MKEITLFPFNMLVTGQQLFKRRRTLILVTDVFSNQRCNLFPSQPLLFSFQPTYPNEAIIIFQYSHQTHVFLDIDHIADSQEGEQPWTE